MKIFVGLGNPGKQYNQTRHNIGFEVIDELSKKWDIPLDQAKHKGIYGTGTAGGEKILLLKPLTYMNLSGESIAAVMNFFKASIEDVVILYDDLDLPVGKIRLRQKGSAGGHNGIKSTIAHLGSQEFNRIRIGIGRPVGRMSVTDYVLGRFSKEEWGEMGNVIEKCTKACGESAQRPFLQVMNEYNG
ncbi:aminoacyl-tRNA hydrolase [Peribacillus cavernae]|uniref:Peptidyl-tRNA hydrolase n=1 Tax=Peribacillus cavernae TaxID=1674310 RepID=A0A3S0VVY3_9BACI|nr:aminoacyl-tRNA hydrolase [Peribacillus cavernae]MDQ0220898.1 PTH1 family peptidyl-tRNA hydrolase [Peribacillus cavernae]RUQ27287.1 aminoacyl-tRNA hydrolase [Peribacillus cavernae]